MGLTVKETGSNFEIAPAGTYTALCYRIIDLGTQPVTFEGKTNYQHKVVVAWELHGDERMADGRPFVVSKRYTASLSSKAKLREHLEAWRGRPFTSEELKGFQLQNVLGAACLLQVVHETRQENVYANIAAVMRLPKGMPVPQHENPLMAFDLNKPDMVVLEQLSPKMQELIKGSPEWAEITKQDDGGMKGMKDDIPAPELDEVPF